MREQFEKLPEIAKNIDKYIFCETENEYKELDVRYALGRIKINGAWYAFQEQQKRIDGALDLACKHQYSNGERIYNEIKEFLK